MAVTKLKLSSSTDGKAIKVVATASAGTDIHTAHATNLDEIWLWAYNGHSATVLLTIQFGGTSTPDNDIKVYIAAQSGVALVIPGWILSNSQVVKAYAGTANVITITGFVNRIS